VAFGSSAAVERTNRDINALLTDKDIAERIGAIGAIGPIVDGSMNVAQVGAFMAAESSRWADIAKEIGLLPE
jgi:hypothetical protein